ncbi:MAG TPA: M13 family metallopeptidase [Polyangiaceae bacterium]|nr:M13 family metallopeptidase [Polyangiaceae bacterium]
MRRSAAVLAALLTAASCATPAPAPPVIGASTPVPPATPVPPVAPGQSLDLSAMDRSVRPGDDFFLHANGGWYARAEIPADRHSWGVSPEVAQEIEQRNKGLLEEMARAGAPPGSPAQKVGDAYSTYLDEATIEAKGLAPLARQLASITAISDKRALAAFLGSELRADVDPLDLATFHTDHLFGLSVEQDLNDPGRYAPYLLQGGLGMPDRSYYVDDAAPMAALRAKYEQHLVRALHLAGIGGAEDRGARAMALETKIARTHATRLESEDIGRANNPWGRADFASRAPGLDWKAFFTAAHLDRQPALIVWHPRAVAGIAALVASEPLDRWKDYLTARAVDRASFFLTRALADEHFAFYDTTLAGTPSPPPRWRRALDVVNQELGEALGQLYVTRFFPPESKAAVKEMVAHVVAAFSRRIDALQWMAPSTKAKAKQKLATLEVGVGYPDTWRDYGALSIVKGDALGNAERAEQFEYARRLDKLGRPVDRGEWCMLPQVVDAVNLPVRNAVEFPAGILGVPFFDPRATAAVNYGRTGFTIGHEISHSFDNEGAKFDAQGRYANWWTPDDLAHFKASGAALAAQFSAYRPFPDEAVNGEQTLGENIADLAGIAAAYDAWQASLGGAAAPMQDGLTGDQQFFLSYAQSWRDKQRDEALRQDLATDGHAPPRYRVLTVRNIDAWYAAFGVKTGDAMFLPPEARVRVW